MRGAGVADAGDQAADRLRAGGGPGAGAVRLVVDDHARRPADDRRRPGRDATARIESATITTPRSGSAGSLRPGWTTTTSAGAGSAAGEPAAGTMSRRPPGGLAGRVGDPQPRLHRLPGPVGEHHRRHHDQRPPGRGSGCRRRRSSGLEGGRTVRAPDHRSGPERLPRLSGSGGVGHQHPSGEGGAQAELLVLVQVEPEPVRHAAGRLRPAPPRAEPVPRPPRRRREPSTPERVKEGDRPASRAARTTVLSRPARTSSTRVRQAGSARSVRSSSRLRPARTLAGGRVDQVEQVGGHAARARVVLRHRDEHGSTRASGRPAGAGSAPRRVARVGADHRVGRARPAQRPRRGSRRRGPGPGWCPRRSRHACSTWPGVGPNPVTHQHNSSGSRRGPAMPFTQTRAGFRR